MVVVHLLNLINSCSDTHFKLEKTSREPTGAHNRERAQRSQGGPYDDQDDKVNTTRSQQQQQQRPAVVSTVQLGRLSQRSRRRLSVWDVVVVVIVLYYVIRLMLSSRLVGSSSICNESSVRMESERARSGLNSSLSLKAFLAGSRAGRM